MDDISEILKMPVNSIKGVGEARAKLLKKLNILTIEDAVTYYPRGHEDRSCVKKIAQLADGESCSFEGTVVSKVAENRVRSGLTLYKLLLRDETGSILATWYNQHYIKKIFHPGERYIFYGKISRRFRSFEVQSPVYEKLDSWMENSCRIVPVYPSTADLTQNVIRSVIGNALKLVAGKIEEILPEWLRRQYKLSEINYCLQNIHLPRSMEDFRNARYRLAFEELLLLQLGLLSIKSAVQEEKVGIVFDKADEMDSFIASLPFTLTEAQMKVFNEIKADMESPKVMNRLIQGDVGSGKTIIAAMAIFKAVRCGYQAAMMVPTEILAEQHFKSLCRLFAPFGIRTELLTGSQTKKQRNEILKEILEGNIHVVIGTHALIEDSVAFSKLGLVITDEQHRFGVRQRSALSMKGINPDVLVMTATPIPRTLALILYGDLDISIIDQLPPGRQPIKTYVVDNSMRERINKFIRKNVSEGRQVYIVCPLVEESDTVEAKSAVELAENIANVDFRDLRVGLVHGKLKTAEKDETMRRFAAGEIDILVSTTVIEVGVNVPNATVMVIENAERFGLAQLHQLRGRVGRGEHQSYCILYNNGKSDISKERMDIMMKTNDGFVISEKDLELRGPGEFFGTRQHGIPELKIANLYEDIDILKKAQEAAFLILERDRLLKEGENRALRKELLRRFGDRINELSMN